MYKIGIDLGGTSIKAGIVNDGKITDKISRPTALDGSFEGIITDIAEMVKELIKRQKLRFPDIAGIGLGSPGIVDSQNGTVLYSNNIRWDNAPVSKSLEERLGLKVKITNDAKAAALGEALYGAGRDYNTIVLLTLGTGVGGGIVIDKKLYEGHSGAGAILGHISVMAGGRQCSCGRRGCLEAYAGGKAFINAAREQMENDKTGMLWQYGNNLNAEDIFNSAKKGDKTAAALVEEYIYYLGEGITSIINALRPDAVILGGGISNAGEILSSRLADYCRTQVFGAELINTPILLSYLGSDAGIIGAANL